MYTSIIFAGLLSMSLYSVLDAFVCFLDMGSGRRDREGERKHPCTRRAYKK